ncbi:hypothetical protein M0805_008022 [Coniferiporia weirii]|nr:hypothetical protein M0805_008022 [Coniferiporia weirii]
MVNWCTERSQNITTTKALKRRQAASVSRPAFEDDFEEPAEVDDLFASSAGTTKAAATPVQRDSLKAPARRKKGKAPSTQFEEQFAFVNDRLGPSPRASHPQVRANALRRLLHHSEDAAQLERLAELLVVWRNEGRTVDAETTVELIDRCLAWNPSLLVQLFSDRPRYGLTIPSLPEARRILRRLVLARPHPVAQSTDAHVRCTAASEALRNAATFTALFPAHGLPPATSDLACCALLAQACARNIVTAPAPKVDGKGEAEGSNAEADANVDVRQLSALSQRGLVSITADLALALTPDKERRALRVLPSRVKRARLGKGDHAPSVKEKREGGFTQTHAVEWAWVTAGLRDVVAALKRLDNKSHLRSLRTALALRLEKQKGGTETATARVTGAQLT